MARSGKIHDGSVMKPGAGFEEKSPEYIQSHNTFNKKLGLKFYDDNRWMSATDYQITHNKFCRWLMGIRKVKRMMSRIATWDKCLMMFDLLDRRYFTIVRGGVEYTSVTRASRDTWQTFVSDKSLIYKCVICPRVMTGCWYVYTWVIRWEEDPDVDTLNQLANSKTRACYYHFRSPDTKFTEERAPHKPGKSRAPMKSLMTDTELGMGGSVLPANFM